MKVIDVVQGGAEWLAARAGIPSASNYDLILTSKGEPSKQRQKYLYRLAGERLSGKPEESYTNGAMERGKLLEDEARKLYSFLTGNEVQQVGFCLTDGDLPCGASPDGLIGEDGGLEIKCPGAPKHVEYLLNGTLPTEYYQQVQGNLFVTGRKWWDFFSYYPGVKPLLIRVEPDKKFHEALSKELNLFCIELEEIVNRLGD